MSEPRSRNETRWAWCTAAFFGALVVYVLVAFGAGLYSVVAAVAAAIAAFAWAARAVRLRRRERP